MPDIKLNKMIRKLLNTTIAVVITALTITNCDTAEPPPLPPAPVLDTVTVNIIDQTHRSITVEVKTTVNNKNWQIELWRNYNNVDTLAAEFPVTVGDTTIIDDNNGTGLLLDTEYEYYAVVKDSSGEEQNRTAMQTGITLAATSHNCTWKEYEINGSIYDIWGTDENNVYAVGGVRINDSTYGVIKWDGTSWKPELFRGGRSAIYGFSANDIWVVGGNVEHYDGTTWHQVDAELINDQLYPLDSVLFNNTPYTSLWGTSSSNLYLGNQWGKIIHWDGEKGEVIGLNQNMRVWDIYGIDKNKIIVVTGDSWEGRGNLYKIENNTVELLLEATRTTTISGPLFSYWQTSEISYLGGAGLWKSINNEWRQELSPGEWIGGIAGTGSNNIFIIGTNSLIEHYNGENWKEYNAVSTSTDLLGINMVGREVYICGISAENSKIIKGTLK